MYMFCASVKNTFSYTLHTEQNASKLSVLEALPDMVKVNKSIQAVTTFPFLPEYRQMTVNMLCQCVFRLMGRGDLAKL